MGVRGSFVAALHLNVQLRFLISVSRNTCHISIYHNFVRISIVLVVIMCDCIIMSSTYICQDAARCWWSTTRMAPVISHSYRRRSSLIRCRVNARISTTPTSVSKQVSTMHVANSLTKPERFQIISFRFVEELCAVGIDWLCIFCIKIVSWFPNCEHIEYSLIDLVSLHFSHSILAQPQFSWLSEQLFN